MIAKVFAFLDDRLHISAVMHLASEKKVPRHRYMPFYYFGGMTLFFFAIQVATGILLMLYYRPSAEGAFESVEFLMTTVPFGWLIRSIHAWSANLMVFSAVAHLISVYFLKAYRPPRELTWITGCLVLFLALAFGFSGYLLPWNQLSFFATKVGTDIAGKVPMVGEWMLRFLRGGDRVTGGTLSRFYGWHVAILPAAASALLGLHLLLVQIHGMSIPPAVEREGRPARGMRFFPHFALRELFVWTAGAGHPCRPRGAGPLGAGGEGGSLRPGLQGHPARVVLHVHVPDPEARPRRRGGRIEYEAIPILLFGLLGLVLVLVPFLDRGVALRGRSQGFTILGIVALGYVVAMTAWGYQSLLPLYVVLGAAAVLSPFVIAAGKAEQGGPPS